MLARSSDGGVTWLETGPLWPHLSERWSILVSVSRAPNGELFTFGTRCAIDRAGESFWCDRTQGLKQNDLVWSRSDDNGKTWQEPRVIPMPVPGAAEAPASLCISRTGRWLCCYSPYRTFDPSLSVDRSKAIVLVSDDKGQTWQHGNMLSFKEPETGAAVAGIIELANGGFLGVSWHLHLEDRQDYPNAYALSDDGLRWRPTRSTGIMGQSVGLAALPDGRALMTYNQRKYGEIGVWLVIAEPSDQDFGVQLDRIIWRASEATRGDSSGDHSQWTGFAFGMPDVTVLDSETLLIVLWVDQPKGCGVQYVRVRMTD
jgi:hypothetical protein